MIGSLRGEAVTLKGIRCLLAGSILPNLVYLDLSQNRLGEDVVAELADSPQVASLLGLNLAGTGLREGEARHLLESPHLSRSYTVNIRSALVSTSMERALKDRFYQVHTRAP